MIKKFFIFFLFVLFIIPGIQPFSVTSSIIENSSTAGLYLSGIDTTTNNYFYNNIFNNTLNYYESTADILNFFNTTKIIGENIFGGLYIGGNYWLNWSEPGAGFSETCTDSDSDGICDEVYEIFGAGSAIDYLPLTSYIPDTINPNVTINSPTATTYTTATVEFNITSIDDRILSSCWYTLNSGVTNNTLSMDNSGENFLATSASLSNQAYTAYIYCNDTSNNLNDSESVAFTISVTATTSNGGSSGGGPATTTISETQAITSVTAGVPIAIQFENKKLSISQINLKTNIDIEQVFAKATIVDNPQPSSGGLPEGASYQTTSINITEVNETNLDEVNISFKIDKMWISEQNGSADRVALFRKKDKETQWNILPTTFLDEDANYYYFNSISSGFSEFSVFLLPVTEMCAPGDKRCNGNFVQVCFANYMWGNTLECEEECLDGECIESEKITDKIKKIILLSLIFITVVFYIMVKIHRKKSKRKEKKLRNQKEKKTKREFWKKFFVKNKRAKKKRKIKKKINRKKEREEVNQKIIGDYRKKYFEE